LKVNKYFFVFYIIISFLLLYVFILDLIRIINGELIYYKGSGLTGIQAYALLGFVFLMIVLLLREGYLSFKKYNLEE